MKYFFFEENGIAQGPFTLDELISKKIRKGTLVWTNGMENWTPAEKVEDLKDLIVPIPPPLPPPLPKKDKESIKEIESNKIVSRPQDVKQIEISGFKAVKIGSQIWMTENLNLDRFSNGDPISKASSAEEWERAIEVGRPAWCYYDFDPSNGAKYGKLYNGYAVNDKKGLAPLGWKIPSEDDWAELIYYLGGEKNSAKMKSITGWGANINGINQSVLNFFPGGNYFIGFYGLGKHGFWWSSTQRSLPSGTIQNRIMAITDENDHAWTSYNRLCFGSSVRCLKD